MGRDLTWLEGEAYPNPLEVKLLARIMDTSPLHLSKMCDDSRELDRGRPRRSVGSGLRSLSAVVAGTPAPRPRRPGPPDLTERNVHWGRGLYEIDDCVAILLRTGTRDLDRLQGQVVMAEGLWAGHLPLRRPRVPVQQPLFTESPAATASGARYLSLDRRFSEEPLEPPQDHPRLKTHLQRLLLWLADASAEDLEWATTGPAWEAAVKRDLGVVGRYALMNQFREQAADFPGTFPQLD